MCTFIRTKNDFSEIRLRCEITRLGGKATSCLTPADDSKSKEIPNILRRSMTIKKCDSVVFPLRASLGRGNRAGLKS